MSLNSPICLEKNFHFHGNSEFQHYVDVVRQHRRAERMVENELKRKMFNFVACLIKTYWKMPWKFTYLAHKKSFDKEIELESANYNQI